MLSSHICSCSTAVRCRWTSRLGVRCIIRRPRCGSGPQQVGLQQASRCSCLPDVMAVLNNPRMTLCCLLRQVASLRLAAVAPAQQRQQRQRCSANRGMTPCTPRTQCNLHSLAYMSMPMLFGGWLCAFESSSCIAADVPAALSPRQTQQTIANNVSPLSVLSG